MNLTSLISQGINNQTIILLKHSNNNKETTQKTASAIWRIFAELNNPLSPKFADEHAISKMNLTSMEVSMF